MIYRWFSTDDKRIQETLLSGFQARWLGRWFALLQLLPMHQRGAKLG